MQSLIIKIIKNLHVLIISHALNIYKISLLRGAIFHEITKFDKIAVHPAVDERWKWGEDSDGSSVPLLAIAIRIATRAGRSLIFSLYPTKPTYIPERLPSFRAAIPPCPRSSSGSGKFSPCSPDVRLRLYPLRRRRRRIPCRALECKGWFWR